MSLGTRAYTDRMRFSGASLLVALVLGGCYYPYPPPPTPVATGPTLQQRFDQSWSAAIGAMGDQGLRIDEQDRGAGVIRGSRNGIVITATLRTRADGRIEVEFSQSGATDNDPDLMSRVSKSYHRRMGR
jgi:hypothetical protein